MSEKFPRFYHAKKYTENFLWAWKYIIVPDIESAAQPPYHNDEKWQDNRF
jgi:hypothetical protein